MLDTYDKKNQQEESFIFIKPEQVKDLKDYQLKMVQMEESLFHFHP